jgi:hypothetical protein
MKMEDGAGNLWEMSENVTSRGRVFTTLMRWRHMHVSHARQGYIHRTHIKSGTVLSIRRENVNVIRTNEILGKGNNRRGQRLFAVMICGLL